MQNSLQVNKFTYEEIKVLLCLVCKSSQIHKDIHHFKVLELVQSRQFFYKISESWDHVINFLTLISFAFSEIPER